MAGTDDKWRRQHTNATQEDIRQARIAERAVTGAAIIGASGKILKHVDDAVADLRRDLAALGNRVGRLEVGPDYDGPDDDE